MLGIASSLARTIVKDADKFTYRSFSPGVLAEDATIGRSSIVQPLMTDLSALAVGSMCRNDVPVGHLGSPNTNVSHPTGAAAPLYPGEGPLRCGLRFP